MKAIRATGCQQQRHSRLPRVRQLRMFQLLSFVQRWVTERHLSGWCSLCLGLVHLHSCSNRSEDSPECGKRNPCCLAVLSLAIRQVYLTEPLLWFGFYFRVYMLLERPHNSSWSHCHLWNWGLLLGSALSAVRSIAYPKQAFHTRWVMVMKTDYV